MYLDFTVTNELGAPVAWNASSVVTFNSVPLVYGGSGYTVPVALGDIGVVEVNLISDSGLNAPYTGSFVVFGYDLDIPITLVQLSAISSSTLWDSIYTYQRPCTSDLYTYWTSSDTPNEIDWSVNNIEVAVTNLLDPVFTQYNSSFNYEQITGENIEYTASKGTYGPSGYTPTVTITDDVDFIHRLFAPQIQYFTEQEESCNNGEDCGCFIIGEEINSYTNITIPDVDYTVEGATEYICPEVVLTFTLTQVDDPDVVIDTTDYTIVSSDPLIFTATENFPFTLTEKGTYNLNITLETCCETYSEDIELELCNNFNLTQLTCSTYEFENCSSSVSYWVRLYRVSGSQYTIPLTEFPLPTEAEAFLIGTSTTFLEVLPSTTIPIALAPDGIFVLQVSTTDEETEETQSFTLFNFCSIRECYLSILTKVLCKEDGECCDECAEKDMFLLNKFQAHYQLFFSLIASEYKYTDYIEGALDNTKIQDLFDIEILMDKITKLCQIMADCGCGGTESTIKAGGDCGC